VLLELRSHAGDGVDVSYGQGAVVSAFAGGRLPGGPSKQDGCARGTVHALHHEQRRCRRRPRDRNRGEALVSRDCRLHLCRRRCDHLLRGDWALKRSSADNRGGRSEVGFRRRNHTAALPRKQPSRTVQDRAVRLPNLRETSSDAIGSSAAGTTQTRQHSLPRGRRLLVRASGSQRVCWRTYDRRAELAVWSCRVRRSVAARPASFSRPAG
jgi:hypothetical protein